MFTHSKSSVGRRSGDSPSLINRSIKAQLKCLEDFENSRRIIVIDDNIDIHQDFKTVLQCDDVSHELEQIEADLFGDSASQRVARRHRYDLEYASQGKEGVEKIGHALQEGRPYSLAFVDMRMPPGWDGLKTIEHIWSIDASIQIVICTAYSDHSWEEITDRLGSTDNLLILKKPFDQIEVLQLASALTGKWILARLIAERINELEQARRSADIANQVKTKFLANMSHELRTPVHAILSFAEMGDYKVGKITDVKLRRFFSRIEDSGKRLLELLNDLFDLSHLETGRLKMNIAETDIAQLLQEVIEEFQASDDSFAVQMNAALGEDRYIVDCDPIKIQQVVRNILTNAIKYCDEQQTIQIRIERGSLPPHDSADGGERRSVTVSLLDQGIGIPPGEHGRIFDRFTQSSETSTKAGGKGLGLSICKEIVLAHQGRIWAEDNPDGGAVFRFSLPLRHCHLESVQSYTQP